MTLEIVALTLFGIIMLVWNLVLHVQVKDALLSAEAWAKMRKDDLKTLEAANAQIDKLTAANAAWKSAGDQRDEHIRQLEASLIGYGVERAKRRKKSKPA